MHVPISALKAGALWTQQTEADPLELRQNILVAQSALYGRLKLSYFATQKFHHQYFKSMHSALISITV